MNILFILEIIGTVAFAFSGAMLAIDKHMDILGVTILGMTTAIGGGIIRDVLIGITPPNAFINPVYAIVSVLVSVIIFLPKVRSVLFRQEKLERLILLIMDSIGLGVFTVIGVDKAFLFQPGGGMFLAVFVGVVTGVGGGVLRDMFAVSLPYIFVKHFYACASIIGAIICVIMRCVVSPGTAMTIGAVITIVLRLLAARYRWSLPKARD